MKKRLLLTTALTLCNLPFAQASDVNFSLAAGWPYVFNPEISFNSPESNRRWFANYRMGFDDGFSIGMEQGVGDTPHALGIVAGAIGVDKKDDNCTELDDLDGDAADVIGGVIGGALVCGFNAIFDDQTVLGIAGTYSYHFSGHNNDGWSIRAELGYGEASETNEKKVAGGVYIRYQF